MRWGGDDSSHIAELQAILFLQETDIDGFSWNPLLKV